MEKSHFLVIGFFEDTNLDRLTSGWPGPHYFKVDANFDMFPHSMSLMTNRAGLKLLQNLNKSPPVLIGQGEPKTLGFH